MTRNNHYAVAVDTVFLASSIVLFILALLLRNTRVISISLLSIVLAVGMNVFNISISYQKWLDREQPEWGQRYDTPISAVPEDHIFATFCRNILF